MPVIVENHSSLSGTLSKIYVKNNTGNIGAPKTYQNLCIFINMDPLHASPPPPDTQSEEAHPKFALKYAMNPH